MPFNDCANHGTIIQDNKSLFRFLWSRFTPGTTLVDSSKKLKRLKNLVSEGIQPRILHLTRDPIGVIQSLTSTELKRAKHPGTVAQLAQQWAKQNLSFRRFLAQYDGPVAEVAIEQLLGQEERTIESMEQLIEQSWTFAKSIDTGVQHQAGGNRVRFSRALEPDIKAVIPNEEFDWSEIKGLRQDVLDTIRSFGY